jgi:hypothetical protein
MFFYCNLLKKGSNGLFPRHWAVRNRQDGRINAPLHALAYCGARV